MTELEDPGKKPQPRRVELPALRASVGMGAANLIVSKRYEVLLRTAKTLRDEEHYDGAVVLAQTACEVCTEAVLTKAFANKGIGHLREPIGGFISSYNLGSDKKLRKLYTALTEHDIYEEDPARWQAFKKHVEVRNDVVHRGHPATVQEADNSIKAVEYIIGRLLTKNT